MEKAVYLKSNHGYNFRHGIENPVVVGLVMYQPDFTCEERLCYKVVYESDYFEDYISYESVISGEWSLDI